MINNKIQKLFLGVLLVCSVNNVRGIDWGLVAKETGVLCFTAAAGACAGLPIMSYMEKEKNCEKKNTTLENLKITCSRVVEFGFAVAYGKTFLKIIELLGK